MKKLTHSEIQQEAFAVLEYIKSVCQKYDISYFLFYGTLLGAVRHAGFIPWDDDVDIVVLRKDYEKLKNAINDSMHCSDFSFHDRDLSLEYPYLIGRICSNHTSISRDDENYKKMGVFVDVYPIDNISNYKIVAYVKAAALGLLSALFFASTRTQPEPFCRGKLIRRCFLFAAKLMGSNRIENMLKCLSGSTKNSADKKYVGPTMWMTLSSKRNVFRSEHFKHADSIEFNGAVFDAPSNYRQLLGEYYGDFMSLPPEDERMPHHEYKAYIISKASETRAN